jgi:antirestriction protein ArdC
MENNDDKMSKLDGLLDNALSNPDTMKKLSEHYKINGLYNYSFVNSILIAMQGGTIAQSFAKWKSLKRYVKKGEHSNIFIYVPYFRKVKENKNGQEVESTRLTGFGTGCVFDIEQTEGEPLKYADNSIENLTMAYADVKNKLSALTSRPISERATGEARGFISDTEIVISNMSNNVDSIKTLIHEIAHDLLGHRQAGKELNSATKEVEAEGSTALVLYYLGIDCELSQAYISSWKQLGAREVRKSKMIGVADKIIKAIKNEQVKAEAA